jgi:N6-adenosine-specific RNA methylase IME4
MIRLIEKVSDREGFNKLEMFARERRQGWDIWGNELENDVELSAQAKINFNCL